MSALTVTLYDAVRGVHVQLDVNTGEHVALVGRNGAGKSTVLTAISGEHRASRDVSISVRLDERDISRLPLHKRGIASLTQRPALFEHMNAVDNVAYGPISQGVKRGCALREARALLDTVGLGTCGERKPSQLSGGQAQRLALARAFAADPALVLLDEPLAALDVDAAEEMRSLIAQMTEGKTLVFASHDLLDIGAWADRVVCIEEGEVTWDGATRSMFEHPEGDFLASFTGRVWVHGHRKAGEDFVSEQGVHIPVRENESLSGAVRALIDPLALALHCVSSKDAHGDTSEAVPSGRDRAHPIDRVGRVGAATVAWVADVPVHLPTGRLYGTADGGHGRVVAHAPVTLASDASGGSGDAKCVLTQ